MDNILVNMNLIIPAGDAKLGMSFGPVIGQYGLNIKSFCDSFNSLTKNIYRGVPLRVFVIIFKDKKFDIVIKGFELRFLIDFFVEDFKINVRDVYKIFFIMKRLKKYYPNIYLDSDFSKIRCLLYYIRALGVRCIY